MRTKMKTILCLMLAMICVASFSVTAFASGGDEVTTTPETETEASTSDEAVEDIEIPYSYIIDDDGNLVITVNGV